jgi:hypothetical protein
VRQLTERHADHLLTLTSCMPCLEVSSGAVARVPVTAGHRDIDVWGRRALQAAAARQAVGSVGTEVSRGQAETGKVRKDIADA